jgi:hypothetical protein
MAGPDDDGGDAFDGEPQGGPKTALYKIRRAGYATSTVTFTGFVITS